MIGEKLLKGLLCATAFTLLLVWAPGPAHAASAGNFSAGMTLPAFKVPAPGSEGERAYLGIKGSEPFNLSQVAGKIVIVDILDAF